MEHNLFSNFTFSQTAHHRPTSSTSSTIDSSDEISPSSSRSPSPPPISPTSQPTWRPTSMSSYTYSLNRSRNPSLSINELTSHFSRSSIQSNPQPLCARLQSQPGSQPRRRSRRDACDPTRLHNHLDILVRRLIKEGTLDMDIHPSELRSRGDSHEDAIMETDEEDIGAVLQRSLPSSRRPSRNAVEKKVKIRKRRGSWMFLIGRGSGKQSLLAYRENRLAFRFLEAHIIGQDRNQSISPLRFNLPCLVPIASKHIL